MNIVLWILAIISYLPLIIAYILQHTNLIEFKRVDKDVVIEILILLSIILSATILFINSLR